MPQRKYPIELRERAVRMVRDALETDPGARRDMLRRIGDQLGVNPETLRPGTTTADAQRIKDLEKENRELRRANHIVKSASVCLPTRDLKMCTSFLDVRRPYAATWLLRLPRKYGIARKLNDQSGDRNWCRGRW